MLEKHRIKPASKGDPSLLVFTVPAEISSVGDAVDVYALAIELRQGGMLLALPHDTFLQPTLDEGQDATDDAMIGPNSVFSVGLVEETEDLTATVALGVEAPVLVVDVSDGILPYCREYDPVTDSLASILGFSLDFPQSLPDAPVLLSLVKEWLVQRSDERTGFYTAQEDQSTVPKTPVPAAPTVNPGKKNATAKRVTNTMIADQLTALSAQMVLLSQRQDHLEKAASSSAADVSGLFVGPTPKLPPVSAGLPKLGMPQPSVVAKALNLVGPPPKVKSGVPQVAVPDVGQDEPYDALQPSSEEAGNIALAIARQSSAITTLVAHLASQSGDVLGDLTAVGPHSSTTKGVHRREKMQSDLAMGNSSFYLQMMQQLHRRLHPAKPVPQTEAELQQLSILLYLERQGGYKNQREMGLLAWIVGHALDAASSGDFNRTKEVLALLMVSLEQSVVDRGDWSLAYMLCLLEEPPLQVFQERTNNLLHNARPFGPLVPPQWMAVCLQYLKDLEVLATKKNETSKKAGKAPPPALPAAPSEGPEEEPSPRRKPRFPKRPKAKSTPDA